MCRDYGLQMLRADSGTMNIFALESYELWSGLSTLCNVGDMNQSVMEYKIRVWAKIPVGCNPLRWATKLFRAVWYNVYSAWKQSHPSARIDRYQAIIRLFGIQFLLDIE